jgi:hypothetical protein
VLGGGGFRSYYHLGFFKVIKELSKEKKIYIRNIIGTSSGAISAVYHVCEISDKDIISSYSIIRDQMSQGLSLHDATIYTLRQVLPVNAHIICSGKVRIYVSVLGWTGLYPKYIDHFETFEDLIKALSASINIPYLTSRSLTGTWINDFRCYDGLFTSIVPSIQFHNIPQLEISTHKVLYPTRYTLNPGDPHIYLLGFRGLIEAQNFFNGLNNFNSIIRWIEPRTGNKQKSNFKSYKLDLIIPGLMWIYAINFGLKN